MTVAPPLATIPVGVIVERRKAASPWIDFTWRAVSVLVGEPDTPPWTTLSEDAHCATLYVGAVDLELYRIETAHYDDNLRSGSPRLWVALRSTGGEPPYELFAVTADPAEGEALTEAGSNLVDVVPMPPTICAQIEAFVAEHHVDRPFYKRERVRADPESLARRTRVEKEQE
jgi:hypothetical protein